jgi:class II lanthipeptide synthase
MTQQTELAFLKQAELIGEKICRRAYWSDEQCYWEDNFNDLNENNSATVRRPVGPDVYFGASGIALFLAALYSLAPDERYRTTAESSAKLTLTLLDDLDPRFPIGFYVGYLGTAYTLLKLGEDFANQQFIASALQLIRRINDRDIAAQELDVISGIAGAIPVLLTVYRKYSDESDLNMAVEYGERLVDNATRSDEGLSWFGMAGVSSQTLTQIGFAHGDAGIAWALLELSAVTGEKRFLIAAEAAFQYQQLWLKLFRQRLEERESLNLAAIRHLLAWCNGAVGICFSRMRAYELTGRQIYKDECEEALSTVLRYDMTNQNYSLCHGIAGTADLFIYASQILGDVGYKDVANQKGREGIEQIEKKGLPWPCGSSLHGETLNLMSGLAGIGYFYLRLYDPKKIPPLTILQPEICLGAGSCS